MNDSAAVAVLPTSTLPAVSAETQAFELQLRKAKVFAASSLVPQQYRNNLPDCVIAMNMANRIGADVLQVMQNLYIVQGKPGWSAQFLIATFNQSGKFSAMRFEWQGTHGAKDWGCRAYATEKATGEVIRGAWVTWKMAESEGWTKKNGSKWLTMPEMMMQYRAAAFLVRTYAPEIAMGLQTADEIIDVTPAAAVAEQAPTKADAIANALRTRAVDTDTGEIEPPTHLTYAQVRHELEIAKTDDDRALAADMIRSVADETQRAELTELAKLLADAPG
ncbi:MAG: hypothetical protein IPN24_11315 [Betaproteobacteria bacterium]|nr:hypothetical protein [Betaproteobacteria bacterium]